MFEKKEERLAFVEGYQNIVKPENPELLTKLEKKLEEYRSRLESIRSKYEANPEDEYVNNKYHDSLYKFAILGTLLNDGVVDELKIISELNDLHKGINTSVFGMAFRVIKAYVEGVEVGGGTGLKK